MPVAVLMSIARLSVFCAIATSFVPRTRAASAGRSWSSEMPVASAWVAIQFSADAMADWLAPATLCRSRASCAWAF